ncbi:ABC transporter ATP-binding protein [Aestuariibius sp. 2305UL40-4]|uniref:ABC transporter ATP-binding protein n=1 Tax=Aestuariibius violaceus TaxID=3234132 RepID=UPI00345E156A
MRAPKGKPTEEPSVLFFWLWRRYLAKHKWWLALAMAMMSIEGAMAGLLAYMLKPMFDVALAGTNMGALWTIAFIVFGTFVVRGIMSVCQKLLITRIKQRTAAEVMGALARHLMTLDTTFHQNHPPGYLIERVQGDVGGINSVWSALISGAGRDAWQLISLMTAAIIINPQWTLIALVGLPVLVLPAYLAQRYVRQTSREARELSGKMSLRLDEIFHGINPVKLNALEEYQGDRYEALVEERNAVAMKSAFGRAMVPGMADVMAGIGFFAVLVICGRQIINGQATPGDFVAFFFAIGSAFDPVRRLASLSGLWASAAAGIERVRALFDTHPSLTVTATPRPAPRDMPEIRLEEVELAYEDLPVLRRASFVAEAGKTTALVGASGAGKSTVFNVLTRLVEPQAGRVRIAGVPIEQIDLAELRGLFSVVTQDALLFDESLKDNVLLGRDDVSEDELQRALDAAYVTPFLDQLADGVDSPVGPRGSNLSGGQRQRVAIARALLRDTPILLLDEATSALDTKSEAIVQSALDKLSQGRTTLVIAHRLSTVRNADKIVVMDQGRVMEEGSHDALLAKGGLYADLYRMQFEDEDRDGAEVEA